MIKYKACFLFEPRIIKIEIEKETESSIWFEGQRRAKETNRSKYFDTFDEAKLFLIDFFEQKAVVVRRQLEKANGYVGNAKGLKEA